LSHHCPLCQIHLCNDCIDGSYHILHADHELLKADSRVVYSNELFDGRWFCDNCKRDHGDEIFM
jgi:hypothetical protein